MSKKAKEDEDNQNENNEAGPESEKALELAKNERQELTDKARAFLASPQVRNEDIPAKRRFLAEKGLTDVEIDQLIQELPAQAPSIPPRTYPQPPPSNLPNLLAGVLRIITWTAGGSAAIVFVYMRYILPKLTNSFHARNALQNHQRDLLTKLNASLGSLRTTQKETFDVLPPPLPPVLQQDAEFAQCNTVEELKAKFDLEKKIVPPFTLLRCTISSVSEKMATEVLFKALEDNFPHLNLSQDMPLQEILWQTLTSVPLFTSELTEPNQQPIWSYTPPSNPPPTAYVTSLTNLSAALPSSTTSDLPSSPKPSRFQHALTSMTDFTGYLTTETYPLPYNSGGAFRPGTNPPANTQQEDLKKEIRALKGLVLNRRTFTLPRPASAAQLPFVQLPPRAPTPTATDVSSSSSS